MKDGRRFLMILELLHKKTDANHYETTRSILEYLESRGVVIDRKTLAKDISSLIEMGYKIEKTKSSPNKYSWVEKPFDNTELQILADAVMSSRFISTKQSKLLVNKLTLLASDIEGQQIKEQVNCIDRAKPIGTNVYGTIKVITAAIRRRRRVVFKYLEYGSKKEKRYKNDGNVYRVSPYKLYRNSDNYYLIGWCEKHEDVTVFRIDRMENCRTSDEKYKSKPRNLIIDDFASQYFQMYDGKSVSAILEVRNDLMKYIIDKFGLGVVTKTKTENTFVTKVEVRLSPTFYGWVFQFAGGIRILEPEEAVAGFNDMLACYKG